eukprot:PhF_6_TR9197/c0_g1_i5/m.14392
MIHTNTTPTDTISSGGGVQLASNDAGSCGGGSGGNVPAPSTTTSAFSMPDLHDLQQALNTVNNSSTATTTTTTTPSSSPSNKHPPPPPAIVFPPTPASRIKVEKRKTQMCRSLTQPGFICTFGATCAFAHTYDELRYAGPSNVVVAETTQQQPGAVVVVPVPAQQQVVVGEVGSTNSHATAVAPQTGQPKPQQLPPQHVQHFAPQQQCQQYHHLQQQQQPIYVTASGTPLQPQQFLQMLPTNPQPTTAYITHPGGTIPSGVVGGGSGMYMIASQPQPTAQTIIGGQQWQQPQQQQQFVPLYWNPQQGPPTHSMVNPSSLTAVATTPAQPVGTSHNNQSLHQLQQQLSQPPPQPGGNGPPPTLIYTTGPNPNATTTTYYLPS